LFPKNFAILVGAYVLWKRVPCGGSSMWEGTLTELKNTSPLSPPRQIPGHAYTLLVYRGVVQA